ncbi:EpsG family protein [Neobacillus sp. NRS-1170]|uniref:EpsG family protein n=1 Tax=Neobacillus sp. NRS-1170 TaxID=3233898 RepID=UPI003D26FD5D
MIYFFIVGAILLSHLYLTFKPQKKIENIWFFSVSFVLFLFAALRDGIGFDFKNYRKIFRLVKHHESVWNIEPGFYLINYLCGNFHWVIFISALLAIPLKIFVINKYSEDKLLSLFIYFTGVFIMYDMGVIRQGISIAIAFFSIQYILNRSLIKFLAVILLASSFHVTALVFIPLYFISSSRFTRKAIYGILIVLLAFSLFDIGKYILITVFNLLPFEMIVKKVNYYANINTANITLSLLKRMVLFIICVEFFIRKGINDAKSLLFLNGFFLSIILMGLFSSIDTIAGRGVAGLQFFQIFLIPILFTQLKTKIRKLGLLVVIVVMAINTMMGPINQGNRIKQPYTPYDSILTD